MIAYKLHNIRKNIKRIPLLVPEIHNFQSCQTLNKFSDILKDWCLVVYDSKCLISICILSSNLISTKYLLCTLFIYLTISCFMAHKILFVLLWQCWWLLLTHDGRHGSSTVGGRRNSSHCPTLNLTKGTVTLLPFYFSIYLEIFTFWKLMY